MAAAKKQKSGATPASANGVAPQKKRRTPQERAADKAERRAKNSRAYRAQSKKAFDAAQRTKQLVPSTAEFIGTDTDKYTDALGRKLYQLVATGHSMDEISKLPGMPTLYNILTWATTKGHPFGPLYEEAKQRMTLLMEERVVAVAAQPTPGETKTTKQNYDFKTGEIIETTETRVADNVERARLYSDALRWRLSILQPKRYGRNADLEVGKPNEQLKALFDSLKSGPAE